MSVFLDKEALIELVRSHRALYDKTLPEYHDRCIKANCWKAVAASFHGGATGMIHFYSNVLIWSTHH